MTSLRAFVRTLVLESLETDSALKALAALPEMANDEYVFAASVFDAMIPHAVDHFGEATLKRWSDAAQALPLVTTSLRGLTACQRSLSKELVARYIMLPSSTQPVGRSSPGAMPFIVELQGGRYVLDGHNRLAAAILRGDTTAQAKVLVTEGDV